jgi:F-type H+-transporting ATPase subunit epsilon
MYIEILTPEMMLFSGEVKLVEVPGSKGPFVMLNKHAPIMSLLEEGTLRLIEENNREHTYEISGGVVENMHNKLVALVEIAKKNQK